LGCGVRYPLSVIGYRLSGGANEAGQPATDDG
jgi:hypothetical protein